VLWLQLLLVLVCLLCHLQWLPVVLAAGSNAVRGPKPQLQFALPAGHYIVAAQQLGLTAVVAAAGQLL
jgi:hypothetical protein